jgi:hypothetical protein
MSNSQKSPEDATVRPLKGTDTLHTLLGAQMKAAVRRVLMLSAMLSPQALFALGLGDIKLNSALNQPFDAEIELVAATPDDLSTLRATLASGDTFTRYGLDRPPFLSDFGFQVARSGSRDVLRVTSSKPVTEPFVTLLVEANWPRGRLLREVHGPARSAGVRAGRYGRASAGGDTEVCGSSIPGGDRILCGACGSRSVANLSAVGATRDDRARVHLPGSAERYALADRKLRAPGWSQRRQPGDAGDL